METEIIQPTITTPNHLPEGWKTVKLTDVVLKVGSGVTPKGGSRVYLKSGIPLIRSQNVLTGKLVLEDVAYISDEQNQRMRATWLQPADVLLNITGASIGRSCVVPSNFREGNVNQHVCIIRTDNSKLIPNFLDSFLQSPEGQAQIDSFQAGGNRQGLNYDQVRSFIIPLPSLAEQQRIATILMKWDEGIEKLKTLISRKKDRKQALMQQLLTGQRRFNEFDGQAWETVRLGDVANINKTSLGEKTAPNLEFFYIDLSAVKEGKIDHPKQKIRFDESSPRARRLIEKGDIIMSTVRPNLKGFGVINFDCKEYICSTGFAIIRPSRSLDTAFLYQSIYSSKVEDQIGALVTGSNYPAINATDVSNLIINFPVNPKERDRIAAVLSAADREIEGLTRELALLKEQKRGLMQGLLTGHISVKTL